MIFLRHIKELAGHYILGEECREKSEKEDEKKEEENVQLFYYLIYMLKSGISESWPITNMQMILHQDHYLRRIIKFSATD